jgi:hypothetical protein
MKLIVLLVMIVCEREREVYRISSLCEGETPHRRDDRNRPPTEGAVRNVKRGARRAHSFDRGISRGRPEIKV